MTKVVVADPVAAEQLIAWRKTTGIHRFDELWDGEWHMPSAPSSEHQRMERELEIILVDVVERPGLGQVRHQINVMHPLKGMADFRIPDISVVLAEGQARLEEGVTGGPDLVVEIRSPGDESLEKLPWYAEQGVREALVMGRESKDCALYRLHAGELRLVGASPMPVESEVVPLRFEKVRIEGRNRVRVTHLHHPERTWLV